MARLKGLEMKAIVQHDIVAATISGDASEGVSVPVALRGKPIDELRHHAGRIKHLSEFSKFFVDDFGKKRVERVSAAWPEVTCAWNAALVRDGDSWRIETAADKLAALKAKAKTTIDAQAERLRQSVITPGEGQVATYLAQEAEAKLLLAVPDTETPTPYLSALVGIVAPTLLEVAEVVAQMSAAWNAANAAINAARLTAKNAVDQAATEAAVMAAMAGAQWPTVSA